MSTNRDQNEQDDLAFLKQRQAMVENQLRRRDIHDQRILRTMLNVERHRFVLPEFLSDAYEDIPLPIGFGQTISQPYIVALMTQLVRPQPSDRALEIGTGCGYQTAVLAHLVEHVYSIEIVEPLARQAQDRLTTLGLTNVSIRPGDGFHGWPEHAPFDIILIAAAPIEIPQPLLDQLAIGGRLIVPVGKDAQELKLIERHPDGQLQEMFVADVRFVPMTGEAEDNR
jgi:protein-L-isoaspartate(D-aspartate) O-methyltransferase